MDCFESPGKVKKKVFCVRAPEMNVVLMVGGEGACRHRKPGSAGGWGTVSHLLYKFSLLA